MRGPLRRLYSRKTVRLSRRGTRPQRRSSTAASTRGSPDYEYPVGTGTTSIRQNIVTDQATGRVFVAWCSFGTVNGVFVQEVNPASGAPAGQARALPGSTTTDATGEHSTCNLDSTAARMPLSAGARRRRDLRRRRGRLPDLLEVLAWRLAADGAVAQTITVDESVCHTRMSRLRQARMGVLLVGWTDGSGGTSRVAVRSTDTAGTTFEPVVSTRPPSGTVQADGLDLAPQSHTVDVLARFSTTAQVALWHTQLTAAPAASPVLGQSVVSTAVSGTVLVRAAGTNDSCR